MEHLSLPLSTYVTCGQRFLAYFLRYNISCWLAWLRCLRQVRSHAVGYAFNDHLFLSLYLRVKNKALDTAGIVAKAQYSQQITHFVCGYVDVCILHRGNKNVYLYNALVGAV